MKNINDYCLTCNANATVSTEEIAAEIQVVKIAIEKFKLCIACKAKVEAHLRFIRTQLLKDENDAPSLAHSDKRMLRIGLAQRTKVRDLKSAERRKLYFK